MNYSIIRTDTADAGIRSIVLYIARVFGNEVALEKLEYLEKQIMMLKIDPYISTIPRYPLLKRKGYRVLILEKDLVFYKIDEDARTVTIHAVVDQRQDYLSILRGL